MRATRAYIASAGTAAVMLGASLAMLLMVSGFVAFGAWPGAQNTAQVDQVLLASVQKAAPKRVAVRSDAVAIARRAQARERAAAAARRRAAAVGPRAGTPVAKTPTTAPATQPATQRSTTTTVTTAPASAPAPVQQPAQQVAENIGSTTHRVGTQLQQQVQNVQQQVNDVVNQVVGPQSVTSDPVQTVTDAAGSLLGH